MSKRRPPLLIVPAYMGLAAALERRGCDFIEIGRRLIKAGAVNKTYAHELQTAKEAAQGIVAAIERFQQGEAAAEQAMDRAMNA